MGGAVAAIPFFEVKSVFAAADKNSDGKLTANELVGGHLSSDWYNLRSSFRALDVDSDDFISKREWDAYCVGWMSPRPPQTLCEEMFAKADTELPKGMLSRNEFDRGGRACKTPGDAGCSLLQAAMQQATDRQKSSSPRGSKTGFLQQLTELQQHYQGM